MENPSIKHSYSYRLSQQESEITRKIDHLTRLTENLLFELQSIDTFQDFRRISFELNDKATVLRSLYYQVKEKVSYEPLFSLERKISEIVQRKNKEISEAQEVIKFNRSRCADLNYSRQRQSSHDNPNHTYNVHDQVHFLRSEIVNLLNTLDDCDNTQHYDEIEFQIYDRINELSSLGKYSRDIRSFVLKLEFEVFARLMDYRVFLNSRMEDAAREQLFEFNVIVPVNLYPVYEHDPFPQMSFPLGRMILPVISKSTEIDSSDDESEMELVISPQPISEIVEPDFSPFVRYLYKESPSIVDVDAMSDIRHLFECQDLEEYTRLAHQSFSPIVKHEEKHSFEPFIRYLFLNYPKPILSTEFSPKVNRMNKPHFSDPIYESFVSPIRRLFHSLHKQQAVNSFEPLVRRLFQSKSHPTVSDEFLQSVSPLYDQGQISDPQPLVLNEAVQLKSKESRFEESTMRVVKLVLPSCAILQIPVNVPTIQITPSICSIWTYSRLETLKISFEREPKEIRVSCNSSQDSFLLSRIFVQLCLFNISTDHLKGSVKRKSKLMSASLLQSSNGSKEFIISCDVSNGCSTSVLSHCLDKNRKQDRPIAYVSRKGILKKFGISWLLNNCFYHAQSNFTERHNKNINAALRAYVKENHRNCDEQLPDISLALRTSVFSLLS